ncbi:3-hydroxyisobutyrate dehydrogenase [Cognatishimia maritima]|uniref:3-hydroxyisobutyrate dehydrogenase n=2 Tax=Cognatishimia maritima TaxID=870908 RepID=A0A1M5S6Q1_9RHOB|nr:3-hydroxyisobutyrate dehydrogenase [Cognatishimia maritima]
MSEVGVVGLGRMGSAIALRMSEQGHSVLGWTRSRREVEGIASAPDLETLCKRCETLILSLYDDTAVADVLDRLLELDLTGRLIIDTSTVVPDVLRTRMNALSDKGATAIDAPISGGPELVATGKCGIFIGGEPEAAERSRTYLAALSERIFHVGPLGAGLAMKTVNNGMIQVYMTGLGTFLPVAQRAGLPLETVLRILCGGPAGMPMVRDRIEKILGQDDTVGFDIVSALKDARVFSAVTESYGISAPILELTMAQMSEAIEDGDGDTDVARLLARAYARGALDK